MKSLGWLLFVLGVFMLIFRGTLFTTRKNLVDVGSLEINRTERHSTGWPVYLGSVLALSGGILVIAGTKRK